MKPEAQETLYGWAIWCAALVVLIIITPILFLADIIIAPIMAFVRGFGAR